MDHKLAQRLTKIHAAIEDLAIAEELSLNLSASEKSQFSILFLETSGTVDERKSKVYSAEIWSAFQKQKVVAEVNTAKLKRLLELNFKALDCEYLEVKTEGLAIRGQRGVT